MISTKLSYIDKLFTLYHAIVNGKLGYSACFINVIGKIHKCDIDDPCMRQAWVMLGKHGSGWASMGHQRPSNGSSLMCVVK